MEFQARLVHADSQRRVVQVRAFEGERCLGSSLGEAASAEEAEDRARDRLRQRLRSGGVEAPNPRSVSAPPPAAAPRPVVQAAPAAAPLPLDPSPLEAGRALPSQCTDGEATPRESTEPPADPEDWSADLTRLDRLLRTLGWGREEERTYVQRLFGHPSRNRLTRYADLMVLRRALEALPPGCAPDTAALPLLRADLLAQCDDLLTRLGWTTERARHCLEGQFAVNSRQRLSDDQLLAFNLLLEGELLGQAEMEGADHCLESLLAQPETCSS